MTRDLAGLSVALTGGSGFVGGRTAARLAARGARIRALVRRRDDHPGLGHPNVEQVEGDFVEPAVAEQACQGAFAVVHCAASGVPDLAEARRVNLTGTANLAAAARTAGCQIFLHVSTLAVYAIADPRAEIDEEHPLKTEGDAYGLTKAEAERALSEEASRGLATVVLRPGAILGAHPTSYWAVKIPRQIRRGEVPLLGDGASLFPWVHVEDVVDAVEVALVDPRAEGRAWNVVAGHWVWRDFIAEVRSWFPDAKPAPALPRRQVDPKQYFTGRFLARRLADELGWAPRRSYDEGMAEAAEWWRGNQAGRG